ncbi:MAG: hypothetical protein J5851_07250, partial [Oscillospiraceae bacterium]|nr:hypothetical protein [Oscillospiraceae bacterium]
MKLTQCKDAFRNVKKQFVSYLSVVMIAMLSVMAYLGIHFASRAIADNGTQFYREMHFRDVEVISTKLLTAGDLDAIRAVQGVQDVEGVLQTSGTLWNGTEHRGVDIVSLTDRINTPQLLEGRLPERPDECALEQPIMTALSLSVGDTIRVEGREGENADYLTAAEFTVTGVVFHPEHGCWELQVPANRDVIVLPEVFDTKALDDCYMKALVTVEGTEGMNRFDKDYARTVQGTADALKALAEERTVLRDQEIQGRYQEEIDEGQARLDDAKAQLDDAQEQLDRNREKLSSGEQELDDARQHIEEMSKILTDAEQELAAGKLELDSGTSELSAAEKELSKSLQQLNDGEAKLKASKQQLSAAESDLKQNKARLDDAEQQLRDGRKQLDDSKAELTSAREELTTGFREIDDAKCRISNSIYQAVYDVIGKYADRITFYSGVDNVDPDASDLSATDFLLVKGVRIDLNHSMQENIASLVHKLELSTEEWREVLGDRLTDNIVDLERFAADCICQELASYESQYQTLADGARQWDSGHQTYLDGLEQYRSGEREYDQKKSEYDTAVARYNEGLAAYESGLAQYNKVRSELDEGWAKYRDGLAKYKEAKSKADDGQTLYDSKLQEYEEGLAALEDGERRYQEGQDSLESGRTALEEGEAAYEEHRAEYESGAAELEQAKTDFDALGICRWVVLDMEGNASYIVIRNGVNNVRNMGLTFSLVFVLVGALV